MGLGRGAVTFKEMVVDWVNNPDTPSKVTILGPRAAPALAEKLIMVLVVDDGGLKVAVTPLGNPLAEKVTAPLKPDKGVRVKVTGVLEPWATTAVLEEVESVKDDTVLVLVIFKGMFI